MNRESKQGTERFLKHAMASFGLALMALILPGSLSAEYLCNYEDVSVDPTDSYFACFWGCRADLWNNLACTAPHQANWCARYCADAEADVCEGNPIQLSSGAKLHAETDYQGVGEYPLTLRRYYSTAWTMPEGHWGEKWLGSDFARLVSVHTDTEGDIYTAVRPNGRHIKFTWVANGGGTTRALKADKAASASPTMRMMPRAGPCSVSMATGASGSRCWLMATTSVPATPWVRKVSTTSAPRAAMRA
jgi:hypothetical protein